MPTKSKKEEKDEKLDLGSIISQKLNSKFKKTIGENVAFNLNSTNDFSGVEITDYVSTGIDMLDLAISNKKNGGLPVGRIVDISGLEGSGKSLILAHIMANTQKKGGIGVYFDTEMAFSKEYFSETAGVNLDDLVYSDLSKIEDCLDATKISINEHRDSGANVPMTIGIDSIKGATTRQDDLSSSDVKGFNTHKAIVLSNELAKLTSQFGKNKILFVATNQLRIDPNAGLFEEKYNTPGGKAFDFYSSVRIRLKLLKKISAEDQYGIKHVIGRQITAKVYKNRLGPPERTVTFDLLFNSGIQNFKCTMEYAIMYKIIKQSGSWKTIKYKGVEYKFQKSGDLMNKLYENGVNVKDFYDWMLNEVSEKYISKYEPKEEDIFYEAVNSDDIDDVESNDNTSDDKPKDITQ